MRSLAIALFFGAALLHSQPIPPIHVSVSYINAAACQNMQTLIGPLATTCQQNVQVSIWTTRGDVTAFTVTINYIDKNGQPQTQIQSCPATQSLADKTGFVFFLYGVDDITLNTVLVDPQIDGGGGVTINYPQQ